MKPETMLWSSILIGPAAWFLNLEANFAIAPLACSGGAKPYLYLVSTITLLLTLAAAWMAFAQWHQPERRAAGELAPVDARRRGMALAGLGLSALSFLVILAQTIPNLLFAGCE
jgi:hypothetical protein